MKRGWKRPAAALLALVLLPLTACGSEPEPVTSQPPGRLGTMRKSSDDGNVNSAAASALEDMASSMADLTSSLADLQSQVDELTSSLEEMEKREAESSSSSEESSSSEASSSEEESSSSSEPEKADKPKVPDVGQKLTQAKRTNTDSKLWLQIPGTTINDVVVQGKTNTDYSKRDWMGNNVSEQQQENAVVLDFECVIGAGTAAVMPQNTVLYGVNFGTWLTAAKRSGWTDFYQEHYDAQLGRLVYDSAAEEEESDELSAACERLTLDDPNGPKFSQLLKFTNIDFARKTPYIYLTSSSEDLIYEVFAVAYTSSNTDPPYNLASYSDAFFMNLVESMKKKSLYDYDVDVTYNDKLLTLSTDTFRYAGKRDVYGERAKFVVMARLMQDGDEFHKTASLTQNAAPVGPEFS